MASIAMFVATHVRSAFDVDREIRAGVKRVVANGLARQIDISRKAEPDLSGRASRNLRKW